MRRPQCCVLPIMFPCAAVAKYQSVEVRDGKFQSSQLFSTVSLTLLVYSLRLSLYRLDASTLAGEPVLGSLSKLRNGVCQRGGQHLCTLTIVPTFECW